MIQKTYAQSLMTMDINEISKQINSGRNLNRDAGGFRAFEVLLDKKDNIVHFNQEGGGSSTKKF